MRLRIATANRVRDGAVVCLTAGGGWSEWLDEGWTPVAGDAERRAGDRHHRLPGARRLPAYGHDLGRTDILGVNRKGEEFYQVTLGGSADENATIGTVVGSVVSSDQVGDAVETIVDTCLALRADGECFIETYRRVGLQPFKEKLYAPH